MMAQGLPRLSSLSMPSARRRAMLGLRPTTLFGLLSLLLFIFILPRTGAVDTTDPGVVVKCPVGYGGDATLQELSPNQINDGYCDCPTNGIDEPETNACAGYEHWSGIVGDLDQDDNNDVAPHSTE